MDKISVIIPCHNVENYIMRCFDSLKNQSFGLENMELIFIDDASTDNTWEKLQEIEKLAPESVCIIKLEENMRQGGARNIGLSYATGTYVGYVDSDDWIEPDMYVCLYQAIKEDDSDLAFCRHVRDTGKGNLYLTEAQKTTPNRDCIYNITTSQQRSDFIASNLIGCNVWDKLFKKDFLIDNELYFPEHMAYEDIYFGSLVYLYAKRVSMVERNLYHYFLNTESTVLKKNESHHRDIFEVNYLKWDTYEIRGFFNQYRTALEFDFLTTFYLIGFKILALRFDEIPYDYFMELKLETLKRVPNYKDNPYCKIFIPEVYQLTLNLLELPITQSDLIAVQKAFDACFPKV